MKLADWRKAHSLSLSDAAALVGVTTVAFGRYERGRVPDPTKLQRIIEVTKGEVTANDFFEIPNRREVA